MTTTPDHLMACPHCGHGLFRIIVPGASREARTFLCDIECGQCGEVFHPADSFNRIPPEYFREVVRK